MSGETADLTQVAVLLFLFQALQDELEYYNPLNILKYSTHRLTVVEEMSPHGSLHGVVAAGGWSSQQDDERVRVGSSLLFICQKMACLRVRVPGHADSKLIERRTLDWR